MTVLQRRYTGIEISGPATVAEVDVWPIVGIGANCKAKRDNVNGRVITEGS